MTGRTPRRSTTAWRCSDRFWRCCWCEACRIGAIDNRRAGVRLRLRGFEGRPPQKAPNRLLSGVTSQQPGPACRVEVSDCSDPCRPRYTAPRRCQPSTACLFAFGFPPAQSTCQIDEVTGACPPSFERERRLRRRQPGGMETPRNHPAQGPYGGFGECFQQARRSTRLRITPANTANTARIKSGNE